MVQAFDSVDESESDFDVAENFAKNEPDDTKNVKKKKSIAECPARIPTGNAQNSLENIRTQSNK